MQMRVYTIVCVIINLCSLWYVAPTCCVTGTSEIMLDAVLEDVSLELRSSLLTLGRVQAFLTLLSLNRSLGHYRLASCIAGNQVQSSLSRIHG